MTTNEWIFVLFSAVMLTFSVMTIFSRRILRAAMNLLIVLISTAMLYFTLGYEFLAAVQLSLYAGGIVILIVFSVLLTSTIDSKFDKPRLPQLLGGLGIGAIGAAVVITTVLTQTFASAKDIAAPDMIQIGSALTSLEKHGFALPFEVISILLLSALIGSIIIAKKPIK